MRLFILTANDFDIPALVVYQKILDIITAGKSSAQLHFYIVGDHIPLHFHGEYTANQNKVTIIKVREAQKLVTEVSNGMVLHFGATLKGSAAFPQYFIPLTLPNIDKTYTIIYQWGKHLKFKKYVHQAAGVFYTNQWAEQTINKKYNQWLPKFKNAILPTVQPPTYNWLILSETKAELTQGANYFLCFIHSNNLVATLKEFSQFKKWQQTTMALVFVFATDDQCAIAAYLLRGYKYKDSIFIKCIHEVKMEWIAATYAILWWNVNFNNTSWIEWAIHYDVPLLFDQNNKIPESWLRAGEIFSFDMSLSLSDHFKLYYKDEVYRQARANMGTEWMTNLGMVAAPASSMKIPIDLKP